MKQHGSGCTLEVSFSFLAEPARRAFFDSGEVDGGREMANAKVAKAAKKIVARLDKSERESGIVVRKLPHTPESISALMFLEKENYVEFVQRNHIHVGGVANQQLVLEPGYSVFNRKRVEENQSPGRLGANLKFTDEFLDECFDKTIPTEIAYRIRLTNPGRCYAAEIGVLLQDGRDEGREAAQLTELRGRCGKRNRKLMDNGNVVDDRLKILIAEFPELELDKKSLGNIQRTESNRVNISKAKQRKTKTS